jgi:hypothetical protein
MPKSERSEQMLREHKNEACFDFDANETFKNGAAICFWALKERLFTFLFILAPPKDHRPKGGNPWGQSDCNQLANRLFFKFK